MITSDTIVGRTDAPAPSGRGMRVAQVCADRGIAPGSTKGAAQHLRGIASGLTNLGHEVTLYSRRLPEGPYPTQVLAMDELQRLCPGDVDLVYERYSLGHRAGLDHARGIGAHFVLEVNAPLLEEATAHRPDSVQPVDGVVEVELLTEADLVITVSGDLTRWVEERRPGPVVTLANGFEPGWIPTQIRETGSVRYPLVFLGHPRPWHGADRLVGLLVALARRGHHPELLVIGGGTGADALRSAAEDAGVLAQFHLTGPLPPQAASILLAQAAIGLAPYRSLANFYFCPLKIIDYLAAGLPVISTRQGDIPALVQDAGILVDPDDDDALTEAVVELLESPERRISMGRSGRGRAQATMTWDHVAARTVEAVASLDRLSRVG